MDRDRIRLVCLDIDGTLTRDVTGGVLPGAVAAVRRIAAHFPIRYVTNATSRPRRVIAGALFDYGFPGDASDVWTPARAAEAVLGARGHGRGLVLAGGPLLEDLAWFERSADGPSVLVASECFDLTIAGLQPAFRRLLGGARLYLLQQNRYFKRGAELMTDVGPVAAFLSYASGQEGEVLGKPSAALYDAIALSAGAGRGEILMAGDDAEFDACAAVRLGLQGVLVRTGKYREGDEARTGPAPTAVLPSIANLPDFLGI